MGEVFTSWSEAFAHIERILEERDRLADQLHEAERTIDRLRSELIGYKEHFWLTCRVVQSLQGG